MMHCDKVGTSRKGALDHYFGQGGHDGGEDMSAAQHSAANGHKICDIMLSIAD